MHELSYCNETWSLYRTFQQLREQSPRHCLYRHVRSRWYVLIVLYIFLKWIAVLLTVVAVDGLLFLSTIVMIKKREEKERYRLIDAKSGYGGI